MTAPRLLLFLALLPAAALPAEPDSILLRELEVLKEQNGPTHQIVATCMASLGNLYLRQGQVEKALPVLRKALLIRQAGLGPRHLKTIEARQQLESAAAGTNWLQSSAKVPDQSQ